MRGLLILSLLFSFAASADTSTANNDSATAKRLARFLNGRSLNCNTRLFNGPIEIRTGLLKSGEVEFTVTEFGDNSLEIQASADWLIVSDPMADIEQYMMIRVYDAEMMDESTTELPATAIFNNFTDKPQAQALYCKIK